MKNCMYDEGAYNGVKQTFVLKSNSNIYILVIIDSIATAANLNMATLNEHSLQTRLERRRGTMSEVDRNHFEKQQAKIAKISIAKINPARFNPVLINMLKTECITKAIKNEEVAAKEKHVRSTIIGTWQERGNSMFWSIIGKQPLPTQVILCWKSLLVLHKILREGHPNVLKDSYVYRKTLRDLFSVYKFQAATYGSLVCEYLKVLQTKLELHHKYPGIPGSLSFTAESPIKIPERDINDIFTFAVESLDYQDLLLSFEENIMKTMDKSKNNSQISSAQCRIAVLVPLLKECSGMYDILVLVLTRLHKNLPPDTLDGHRQRFKEQHRRMRSFCTDASAMTYITNLTSIPDITEQPPDFLIHKYEPKRKKEVVKEEPKPAPLLPQVDERDILIEQLMREIEELRKQLTLTQQKYIEMEDCFKTQIRALQEELYNMKMLAKQATEENQFLKEQMDSVGKEDSDAQEKRKTADEKFNKLKGLYGKLRLEHIELLRKHAETKQKEDAGEKSVNELKDSFVALQDELSQKAEQVESLTAKVDELNKINQTLKIDFDNSDEFKQSQIESLNIRIDELINALNQSNALNEGLKNQLNAVKQQSEMQMSSLQKQLEDLTSGKMTEETARKQSDERNQLQFEELSAKILSLNDVIKRLSEEKLKEEEERQSSESAYRNLQSQSENELEKITNDLQALQLLKEKMTVDHQDAEHGFQECKASWEQQLKDFHQSKEDEDLKAKLRLISSTASECEAMITNTLSLVSDAEYQIGTTCTPEYLKSSASILNKRVTETSAGYAVFTENHLDVVPVVNLLTSTCHRISEVLLHGHATSHMGAQDDTQALVKSCKSVGKVTLDYLKGFKQNKDASLVSSDGEKLQAEIVSLLNATEHLLLTESNDSDVENIVGEEIHATEKVVADAAARIEEMLNKSRKTHSGVQLEVNERILDSCNALMKAIRELILKSKDLQDEIVVQGKGSSSVKEFYKRHHKWTEGLLSAAKSVGWGATILVDAADKVIERKGKFEELIVASHEIAASTAQLVAASRVKASKNSKKLPPLMTASKGVGEATAGVVAAVRSGSSLTEESKTVPDYSKMTLTQAKRYEMDSQVRIHELENELQKERANLGKLRKAHYQIAVELYGEEQVNMD